MLKQQLNSLATAAFMILVFQLHSQAQIPTHLSPHGPDEAGNVPPGFQNLLQSQDLANWRGVIRDPEDEVEVAQFGSDELMRQHWKLKDGILTYDGPSKGVNISTKESYANFELLVDWKVEVDGDSGIYLRGFPQVQIWDSQSSRLNRFGAQHGSGGLWNNTQHSKYPLTHADQPAGSWNQFHIKMIRNRVTIHLNGQLVVSNVLMENYWDRGQPIDSTGPVELQSFYGRIAFRNMFLKPLPSDAQIETDQISVSQDQAGFLRDRELERAASLAAQSEQNNTQHRVYISPRQGGSSNSDAQMALLRQAFEAPQRQTFQPSYPSMSDLQDQDYERRKAWVDYRKRLNNAVPGLQPFSPYGYQKPYR